jgi:NAD(P)-dependent dehydrogenase (short-subunit alcohol dehydrogenase family)
MSDNVYRLDGKTAVVVGAGNGIGRAIATAFAEAGAAVACLDIEAAAAQDAAADAAKSGAKTFAARCDVTSETSVREALEAAMSALGPPRVLVNGAATNDPSGTIVELDPIWWNRVLAVNLTGVYLMSRAAIPHMTAAGGGSIIHIASQMGSVGAPGRPAYCAVKGALIQLAKVMAVDHAKDNIRVNSLSPGAIETRRMLLRHGTMEEARKRSVPLHPIGRLGQPEEISRGALFLASDASSFMTGSDLVIDGGYTAV